MSFFQKLLDHLEWAWGGIANVSGGDWTKQPEDWQDWAAKWRDQYHALLDEQKAINRVETPRILPEILVMALSGSNGVQQKAIAEAGVELVELLLRKNSDYGSSAFDPPMLLPDMPAGVAIRVRMSDKLKRINQLTKAGYLVKTESLDDTLDDLCGYRIIERALDKLNLVQNEQKMGQTVGPEAETTSSPTKKRVESKEGVEKEPIQGSNPGKNYYETKDYPVGTRFLAYARTGYYEVSSTGLDWHTMGDEGIEKLSHTELKIGNYALQQVQT